MAFQPLTADQHNALARAAAATAQIAPDDAVAIVKSLVAAAAANENLTAEIKLNVHTPQPNATGALGIPCIVCVSTPFFSKCLVPPGGDC